MTDRYERIRDALAMGPTPGPWEIRDGRTDVVENAQGYPVCTVNYYPDERYGHGTRAAYIAACDPDTIRELLAEMDALESQVREFRRIGSLLANAAYNLSQHTALKGSTREALDNLRRQWDAAIAAANGGGDE